MKKVTAKLPAKKDNDKLAIHGLRLEEAVFHLVGTSPLIQKRISDDTIEDLERKSEGLSKKSRAPKSKQAQFEESYYKMKRGFGHPAAGFKSSIVEGNRNKTNYAPRIISKWFFVFGDPETNLIPIVGTPIARTDNFRCRAGLGSTTRAFYPIWSCQVKIEFDANKISLEQLIQFVNTAGSVSGIGCWRPSAPSSPGDFGRYTVLKVSNHKQVQ